MTMVICISLCAEGFIYEYIITFNLRDYDPHYTVEGRVLEKLTCLGLHS